MSEGIDLRHLPDTYELPKATWRLWLMLGVSLAFLVIGLSLAAGPEPVKGWPILIIFAVCFVVLLLAMFTRSGVILDRDGFTYQWLFGGKRYAWRDVSEFKARQAGRTRMILFNDATKVETPFSRLSRAAMAGYNSGITAAFIGGKLEDACAVMNAFRERSVRRST